MKEQSTDSVLTAAIETLLKGGLSQRQVSKRLKVSRYKVETVIEQKVRRVRQYRCTECGNTVIYEPCVICRTRQTIEKNAHKKDD